MTTRLRIGALMDERGVTIKELAFRADIAQSTATNLYRGEMKRVDIPVLDRVAHALGVSFKDLFETDEQRLGNGLALPLAA